MRFNKIMHEKYKKGLLKEVFDTKKEKIDLEVFHIGGDHWKPRAPSPYFFIKNKEIRVPSKI